VDLRTSVYANFLKISVDKIDIEVPHFLVCSRIYYYYYSYTSLPFCVYVVFQYPRQVWLEVSLTPSSQGTHQLLNLV
jgi:hypothetical protein